MPRRVLVVGGDAAGMTAASQAMRTADKGSIEVVAFERGPRTSWSACGLPYFVEGIVGESSRLIARTPEQFAERGIVVHVNHEVTSVDSATKTVTVRNLAEGSERTEQYDELILGTGASGAKPPIPGIDARGVVQLRTVDDGNAMDALIRDGAKSAVVVGAGYIGLEVAEALLARGLSVTVVELAATPMSAMFDPEMADLIATAMTDAGVDLRLSAGVEEFATTDGDLRAVVADGEEIACDFAVLGLGVRPNVELASSAGIEVGKAGGFRVDHRMATTMDGIWAAGDCVESLDRLTGTQRVTALGTHANKQGRVLGTNVGGGEASFPGVIGTAITKFQDLEIGRTGLTEAEAPRYNIEVQSTVANSWTKAGYYPGSEGVTAKVIYRSSDGVLLGAQIVGGIGSGKRIDAFALAVWNEMTVEELAEADLSYAPPFSTVWDPVVYAASLAAANRAAN